MKNMIIYDAPNWGRHGVERRKSSLLNRFLLILTFLGMSATFQQCAKRPVEQQRFNIFKSKKAESAYKKLYDRTLQYWPVEYEEVYVNTTLGKAHVLVSGPKNGPPVLLLHGLNASSTMWYPNIKDLSANYRTYAIDFILEPGKSQAKKGSLTEDEIMHWYKEIFEYFKFKQVSIVGASRGGWMGMAFTIKYPEKVNKLIVLSPAQALTPIKLKKKVLDNVAFAFFPKRTKLKKILNTLSVDADKLNHAYVNQFFVASKYAKINRSLFQMTPFSEKDLESIKVPTMVLIGQEDIINNERGLERARKIPNAEVDMVEKTGHFLSFDRPQLINKRVLRFLAAENQ